LRYSLLAKGDPLLQTRFQDTPDVEFVSLTEEADNRNPLAMIMPFAVGFVFLIAIFTTSGTLIQAVVDEKENRTMEILITSLRPSELMTGKIIGLVGLGLVQIAVWLGFVFAAILIARANVENFPTIAISPRAILVAVAWFVPFYLMIAALVTAIGVSVTAVSEAQQAVSLISIVSMFPLYFTFLIVANPHSALSLTLSFIPFSSPLTMLARVQATSNIPIWQYALSWGLLALTAWLAVFLVGRVLHLGMLRYGQRLRWREMARALWQRGS